jgi:hypothetical protein
MALRFCNGRCWLSRRPRPVWRYAVLDDGFAQLLLQHDLPAVGFGVQRGDQRQRV